MAASKAADRLSEYIGLLSAYLDGGVSDERLTQDYMAMWRKDRDDQDEGRGVSATWRAEFSDWICRAMTCIDYWIDLDDFEARRAEFLLELREIRDGLQAELDASP